MINRFNDLNWEGINPEKAKKVINGKIKCQRESS